MKVKKTTMIGLAIIMCLLLTACGQSRSTSENGTVIESDLTPQEPPPATETLSSNQTEVQNSGSATEASGNTLTHIDRDTTHGSMRLSINADVQLPEDNTAYTVTLVPDEDAAAKMGDELISAKYDTSQISQTGTWSWLVSDNSGIPIARLNNGSEGTWLWYTDYTDVANDISGTNYEMEKTGRFGFFTEIKPGDIQMTSAEAGTAFCDYMQNYSEELTFSPYCVVAGESYAGTGFYYVYAEAEYDGIPICAERDDGGVFLYGCISNNGVFSAQGSFLFRAENKAGAGSLVPLDVVTEQLCNGFSLLVDGMDTTIDNVNLSYHATQNSTGGCDLRPVWAFRGETQVTDDMAMPISLLYYADDGSLCGVYMAGSSTGTTSEVAAVSNPLGIDEGH